MADKLIKNLTPLSSPDADDVLPIYDITADDTKKIRIDEIGSSSHVYQKVLDNGSSVSSDTVIADADTMVFNDTSASGIAKKITFTAWATSVFQRMFNKITSLSSAGTLSGSDEMVISQGGVAKKVTYSSVKTDMNTDVFNSIDNLSTELTTPAADDYIPVSDTSDSGTGKKMTLRRLFSSWSFTTSVIANPTIVLYGNNNTTDVNRITFANFLTSVFGKLPSSVSTTLADTDYVGYSDTASGAGKKITVANFIKSVFAGITDQTSKSSPVGADEIIINDSAASYVPKKTTITELAVSTAFTTAGLSAIHSQTAKATIVDVDEIVINDSASSWGVKKVTFTTVLNWILSKYQSIFDKGNDLTEYTNYIGNNYDYLIGIDSDTGTAVKVLPKNVFYETVNSTTVNISIESVVGYTPGLVLVDATSANRTISLPAAASYKWIRWSVKKIDGSTNTVTIDPNGSETIDGAANYVLSAQYSTVTFISDGSAWYII